MLVQSAAPSEAGAQSCGSLAQAGQVFFGIAVNGQCTDLSGMVSPTGKPGVNQASGTVNVGGGELTVNALWDEDPFITFGLTTTNLQPGLTTYSFFFATPIVPAQYTYAQSSFGVTVTPGVAGSSTVDNSAMYPSFVSGYAGTGGAPTNLGVDNGFTPCTATTVTGTQTCNYNVVSNVFAPTFFNELRALITYTQTDAQSVVSITGRVDILEVPPSTTIPEPSAFFLMAAGLGAVGVVARRARR